MFKLIICTDLKGAIGCKGKLLAHYKEDLAYFKEQTLNKVVVMGSTTFTSLPFDSGLPARDNIVLTTQSLTDTEGVVFINGIASLLEYIEYYYYPEQEVFIIGGASVYKQCLPLIDEVHWSKINTTFPEADTFMGMGWVENENVFDKVSTTPLCKDVSVSVYKRK